MASIPLTSLTLPTYDDLQKEAHDLRIRNEVLTVSNEVLTFKNDILQKKLKEFECLLDPELLDSDCRGGCRAYVLKQQLLEAKDMVRVILHQYDLFWELCERHLQYDINRNIKDKQDIDEKRETERQEEGRKQNGRILLLRLEKTNHEKDNHGKKKN